MTSAADKIAGAPISWGVCEVPGWGYQLSPERVLNEMQQAGLAATEFGPDGFLPSDPAAMAECLAARHLTAVGGFTPVVLHEAGHDPVPGIDRLLDSYDASRAGVLVLSAATGRDGYDTRPALDESGWKTLLTNLDRLTGLAAARGVRAVLHPHVGTMVERGEEVQRVLDGSVISLCLDTGHLLIGGTDPAELTRQAPDRIAHAHLKDVDDQIAAQVRSGRLTYTEGVRRGMYRPLGRGDVDFAAIVSHLQGRNYDGWYVLEQDTILTEEPRGEGPVADVRHSAGYLRTLLAAASDGARPAGHDDPPAEGIKVIPVAALRTSALAGADGPVVVLSGEADTTTAGLLREMLATLLDTGARLVTVDAAELSFIDSASLRVLVLAARALRGRHGRLVLARPQPLVARLLEISGADRLLDVRALAGAGLEPALARADSSGGKSGRGPPRTTGVRDGLTGRADPARTDPDGCRPSRRDSAARPLLRQLE